MVKGNGIVFKLNKPGVRELMKSPEMSAVLRSEAASYGKIVNEFNGKNRLNVSVIPGNGDGADDRSND